MTLEEQFKSKIYQTDKFNGHQYLETYNNLFSPIREKVKNILEIGVQKGDSLGLWRDYFINSQAFGVDISLDLFDLQDLNRVVIEKRNAYSKETLDRYKDIKFDVIIDDGSHWYEHMEYVVKNYINLLVDDGIMIIEDIASKEWAEKLLKSVPKDLEKHAKIIDLRHINNRWDDILLVINKG